MEKLLVDVDSTANRDDEYFRKGFSQRIAQLLLRPLGQESFVTVLDGDWGSGKTWVLNQIQAELAAGRTTVPNKVFRFDPWMIGEESDLVQAFLMQIAFELNAGELIEEKATEATVKLLKYAKVLSYGRYLKFVPIPGIDKIGEAIEDATEASSEAIEKLSEALKREGFPSLSHARSQAKEAVKAIEKRLLIFIDDIDRLRPKEVRAVMQLVKSVADFPNTSFLLACDVEQVARLVTDERNSDTGRQYLEKIIQLSIPVPEIEFELLRKTTEARFRDIVKLDGYRIKSYEERLLNKALKFVAMLCRTPRDVVRWANHFLWTFSALKGSVNIADMALAEAVRLKIGPELWKRLVQLTLPKNLAGTDDFENWFEWADLHVEDRAEEAKKLLAMFREQPEFEATAFLFPALFNRRDKSRREYEQEHRRLASPSIGIHYKRFGTGLSIVTGSMVEEWLVNPDAFDDVLGNHEQEILPTHIQLFSDITGFISFDNLPASTEKLKPLITAITKFSLSPLIETSQYLSGNVSSLIFELLLAYEFNRGDKIGEYVQSFPLAELIAATERVIEFSDGYDSSEIRTSTAKSLYPKLQREVVRLVSEKFDDRSLLTERKRIYLVHALSKIDTTRLVEQKLPKLVKNENDLIQFLDSMKGLHIDSINTPPLICFFEDLDLRIKNFIATAGTEFAAVKSAFAGISEERIRSVKLQFKLYRDTGSIGAPDSTS